MLPLFVVIVFIVVTVLVLAAMFLFVLLVLVLVYVFFFFTVSVCCPMRRLMCWAAQYPGRQRKKEKNKAAIVGQGVM